MPDTSQSHRKSLLACLAGAAAGALVVAKTRSAGPSFALSNHYDHIHMTTS